MNAKGTRYAEMDKRNALQAVVQGLAFAMEAAANTESMTGGVRKESVP